MRTALIACVVLAACSSSGTAPRPTAVRCDPGEAAKLLIDRNWLDRVPETPRDHLFVYRFVPAMGGGVFQDRTLYKGAFELFTFEVHGDTVRVVTPEDGKVHTSAFHIDRITDGAYQTDLRLTLDDPPRGPGVYYGWSNEKAVPAMVTQLGL
jgi:hypothetical protein